MTLPESITAIAEGTFSRFGELEYLKLGGGISSFNTAAIQGCYNIKEVALNESIEELILDDTIKYVYGSAQNRGYYESEETAVEVCTEAAVEVCTEAVVEVCTEAVAEESAMPIAATEPIYSQGSSYISLELFTNTEGLKKMVLGANTESVYSCIAPSITINEGLKAFRCAMPEKIYVEKLATIFEIDYYSPWDDRQRGCIGSAEIYDLNGKLLLSATPKSVKIPQGTTKIGKNALCGCESMTSVTIPSTVTTIGKNAFCGCTALTSVTIPSAVTEIGESAFDGCSSLTSATISNGVKRIEDEAFRYCTKLKSVTLPNSVTYIGSEAFYGCSALTSVALPKDIYYIRYKTFYNCTSLSSVTLPKNVSSIESYAFYGCSKLSSLTIPYRYTSLGDSCFCGTFYDASHTPMSKVSASSLEGVYTGKANIEGKWVSTILLLFDDGTYMKNRLDGSSESLYEVGRYTVSGSTLTLTLVGKFNKSKSEYVRISGGETISVNTKTGALVNYSKKHKLWSSSDEYYRVTGKWSRPKEEYTSDNFDDQDWFTYRVLQSLKNNIQVRIY